MTQHKHIVQVHPIENGLPDLNRVELTMKFNTQKQANKWITNYNNTERHFNVELKAFYSGHTNTKLG